MGASLRIDRHTNDRADAGAPKHFAAPLLPADDTGQGAANDIVEIVQATEAGCLQHRLSTVPARDVTATQEAAHAATEEAAAADRRLDLLGNQMGRIALAVSSEVHT
jgi:hypothetical protein